MNRFAKALLVALVVATPVSMVRAQKVVDLDAATILDINAAFDAGTLTAEQLVQRFLSRITAYDRKGPSIHAVMVVNPKALETARALTFDTGGPMARSVTDVAGALKGARIGVARDFMGQDADVDWVMASAITTMRSAGATIVDVRVPKWLLDAKHEWYNTIRFPEFPVQIHEYLKQTSTSYPKPLAQSSIRHRRAA